MHALLRALTDVQDLQKEVYLLADFAVTFAIKFVLLR